MHAGGTLVSPFFICLLATHMPAVLTLLLAIYTALSLADWALTSWAFTAGWLSLGGNIGWRKGNPVTVWALAHGGAWAFLGFKLLLFAEVLLVIAGMRRVPWRLAHWFLWGALAVATLVQAYATGSGLVAVLAHLV